MSEIYAVINADQRNSRRHVDHVDAALAALADIPAALTFERTAGDEIQGAVTTPEDALAVVTALSRLDAELPSSARPGWHIGIGVGAIDDPSVATTRAARGPAYLAARAAIDVAKTTSDHLALRADSPNALYAEDALALLRHLLRKRSPAGWESVELMRELGKQSEVAATVGVSESAVSQRLTRALWQEEDRARRLALVHLRHLWEP